MTKNSPVLTDGAVAIISFLVCRKSSHKHRQLRSLELQSQANE